MDFQELVQNRYSVRNYQAKPVEDEKLLKVMEAARLAPSASNRQTWKFIIVKNEQKRKELARAGNNQQFIAQAPVVIAAVSLEPQRIMPCGIPSFGVDLAIAIEHISLAAANEGLGTCWIGAFSPEDVSKALNIPDKYRVVTIMPLGYPEGAQPVKSRKGIQEITCYEKFSE